MARFNLNIYFALDAILRSDTLTEAARSIHLSQPAMSLALKRLRETFNDEIVRYDHGRTEFTPLAQQLKPRVAEILLKSREVLEMSRAFDPSSETRTFRLAAPETTLFFLMPKLVAALALDAPGITVEAVAYPLQGVEEPRPDLFILPEWAANPAEPSHPIFHEEFSCLLHADAGIQEPDEAMFAKLDHAALPTDRERFFWPEDSPARHLLARRHIVATARKLDVLPHLVLNRRLVAIATSRFTQYHAAVSPMLISTRAPAALAPVIHVLQAAANRASEPAIRWLIKQVELVDDVSNAGTFSHLPRK